MDSHKSSLFLEIETDNIYDLDNCMFGNLSPYANKQSKTPTLFNSLAISTELCHDDLKVQKLTHEMECINKNITEVCEHESNKIGFSSSSDIYDLSGNPNMYIKISNLPYMSYLTAKRNTPGITCETIVDRLTTSINEIDNSLNYSKLIYEFPRNIMKIESAQKCKRNYTDSSFFANKFIIEKVNGITLDSAITSMTETQIICCVMQLVYILSYANLNGYFHNDITCNNIMIYYDSSIGHLILNKLFLYDYTSNADCLVQCDFQNMGKLPIVKLIDFSYSAYISSKLQQMHNNVVIGEPQQILKILKNQLKRSISLYQIIEMSAFDTIYNLFEELNTGNFTLKFSYSELEHGVSSMGFRVLSTDEILKMSINKTFAHNTLLKCFKQLEHFFMQSNFGITISILNTHFSSILPKK